LELSGGSARDDEKQRIVPTICDLKLDPSKPTNAPSTFRHLALIFAITQHTASL
jgi:hypothetical protein